MIIQAIINTVITFLSFLIESIPVFPALDWLADSLQLSMWLAIVNYYFPLGDFVVAVSSIVACWVVGVVFRVAIDLL